MSPADRFAGLVSSRTQYLHLPRGIELESGVRLAPVDVAYRTWGHATPERDNGVLVCHALTGSADLDRWWPGLLGTGRCLDPERDLVICANVLGSCYGTTGPASPSPATGRAYGAGFPAITVRDLARLQMHLLDALGVRSVRLAVGGSLGGMQALELALMDPGRVQAVAVIAAAASQPPWCIGLNEAQRAAIEADPYWCDGSFDDVPPAAGLAAARMMAMCSYRSPQSFAGRFGRSRAPEGTYAVESFLRHHGSRLVERFDARSYVVLSRVADSHDVGWGRGSVAESLATIRQPVLVVGIDSDHLYVPDEQRALAAALPCSRLRWIESPHGHDAFLIEVEALSRLVCELRADIEPLRGLPRRAS